MTTNKTPRFEIPPEDDDLPASRLLRKFETDKPAEAKKVEDAPVEKTPKQAPAPIKTSPKVDKSPDVATATPAADPASTDAVSQQKPSDELIIVPFKAGIPAQLASRQKEILSASSMSEAYLMDYLFSRAIKLMETIDMQSVIVERDGPTTLEPFRSKRLIINASMLDNFRAAHDPLEVFKIVDCVRYIYIAAYDVALNELPAKLKL